MKLLFDQNLSPSLVNRLEDVFPQSAHVCEFNLSQTPDGEILDFAEAKGFILVSKDSDFFDPQIVKGKKAKIVWLRRGNCSTNDIEQILRKHENDIKQLSYNPGLFLLMLY